MLRPNFWSEQEENGDKQMLLLAAIVLGLIIVGIIVFYNRLVKLGYLVDEAWSGIDVQLKRRLDLIPNLVAVVKSYATYESDILTEVTRLRFQSQEALAADKRGALEKNIGTELKNILALAESYPELKANENFLSLQKNLSAIEDDLQYARRYFNGTVRDLNISVQSFPSNIIASLFAIKSRQFFELEYATERKNPDVSF